MLILLTSCHRVAGNKIHFEMVSASIQDNKLEIQTYWGLMSIDKDSKKYNAKNRYDNFIQNNKDKKILFLELGVGFSTPVWIKYPFILSK